MVYLQRQGIPANGLVSLTVIEDRAVHRFDGFEELLRKRLLQILAAIVVPMSGVGEDAARPLFRAGADQRGHGYGLPIWVFDGLDMRAKNVDQMIFFVRVIQSPEGIRHEIVGRAVL